MLDHLTLHVKNLEESKAFYLKALEPIAYEKLLEFPGCAGLGAKKKADLWLAESKECSPFHLAFRGESCEEVDAFYAAAIEAGGKCNGKPGPREIYHPGYYGAFVIDPDGYNIEVCFHNYVKK